MADIVLDTQGTPTSPAAGQGLLYVDSTTKKLVVMEDTGFRRTVGYTNWSLAAQSPAAATRTYLTGSNIVIPAGKLQVGTLFRWMFTMTKTAAGVAASTVDIAFGTAGTTADVARVSFTKPAGTAVADEATCIVWCIIRAVGASGVFASQFHMSHNLAATGHAVIPTVDVNAISAGFDMTTVSNIGLCITTGAADAITIQLVQAEVWNI
jgi:hypothetical protein